MLRLRLKSNYFNIIADSVRAVCVYVCLRVLFEFRRTAACLRVNVRNPTADQVNVPPHQLKHAPANRIISDTF